MGSQGWQVRSWLCSSAEVLEHQLLQSAAEILLTKQESPAGGAAPPQQSLSPVLVTSHLLPVNPSAADSVMTTQSQT